MSYMSCPACDLCVDNVTHIYHATGSKEEALTNIMKLPKSLRYAFLYEASLTPWSRNGLSAGTFLP